MAYNLSDIYGQDFQKNQYKIRDDQFGGDQGKMNEWINSSRNGFNGETNPFAQNTDYSEMNKIIADAQAGKSNISQGQQMAMGTYGGGNLYDFMRKRLGGPGNPDGMGAGGRESYGGWNRENTNRWQGNPWVPSAQVPGDGGGDAQPYGETMQGYGGANRTNTNQWGGTDMTPFNQSPQGGFGAPTAPDTTNNPNRNMYLSKLYRNRRGPFSRGGGGMGW